MGGLALGVMAVASGALAQQRTQDTRDTYGEVGLLDMPSAHMADDGTLDLTAADLGKTQRYALSFQMLPWLETSFRYSHIPDWMGQPSYYDRSLGLKIRLLREAQDGLDASLGVRDLLGTGVYGAEYLAFSKHIGDFDFIAGLGWGRLAGDDTMPNPFGYLSTSFKDRKPPPGDDTVDIGQLFHGPKTGVFGGVAWLTPIDHLQLIAEYSSDKYTTEGASPGGLKVRSPVNVGLSYSPIGVVSVTGGWMYGSTYGVTVSLSGTPTTVGLRPLNAPPVPPAVVRSDKQQEMALRQMMNANTRLDAFQAGGPWAAMPTPAEKAKQDLSQVLFAETRGVRDLEVLGTTLVINAVDYQNTTAQCASYAQAVPAADSRIATVAVSDLEDPSGHVTFCPVGAGRIADVSRPSPDASARPAIQAAVRAGLRQQSIVFDAMLFDGGELWLYYENSRYARETEAVGRIVRVLTATAPSGVEIFHLVAVKHGVPLRQITVVRSAIERAAREYASAAELGPAITIGVPPLDNPALDNEADLTPRFRWWVGPAIRQDFLAPHDEMRGQIAAAIGGSVDILPGATVDGAASFNLYDNYAGAPASSSKLEHVRSDVAQYVHSGADGISSLEAVYRTRLAPDVVAEFKAGYLEDMFAGAGGQVLWRPEDGRLAFGLDLYEVWRRDYNRLFGVGGYKVLTGHASIYYRSPWYGLDFALHAGRYLAGDNGGTIEITRRFGGIEAGVFATVTDTPFAKSGVRGFDKGFVLRIPLEWLSSLAGPSPYDMTLRPLTRDGGQRLEGDDSLFQETQSTSYGDLVQNLEDIVTP
jgi:hypothetical protein